MSATSNDTTRTMERVTALDDKMPERIDEKNPRIARKFMESVKSDSAGERAVFDESLDVPETTLTYTRSQRDYLANIQFWAGTPMLPEHPGYVEGWIYMPLAPPQQQELAYLSAEYERLNARVTASDEAAAKILARLSRLDGLMAVERDTIKRRADLTPAQQVRTIFTTIAKQFLGSEEDAVLAINEILNQTGVATCKSEIYVLITRVRALLAEKRQYLTGQADDTVMSMLEFKIFLRARLGTATPGTINETISKAHTVIDTFVRQANESNDAAIERMMADILKKANEAREITQLTTGGHSASREAQPTAHAAMIDDGPDERYQRGFIAGMVAAAGGGNTESIQRTRRELEGTIGYNWNTRGGRAEKPICRQYAANGRCTYGSACRFSHATDAHGRRDSSSEPTRQRSHGSTRGGHAAYPERSRSRDSSNEHRGRRDIDDRREKSTTPSPSPARHQAAGTPERRRRGGGESK
jgi:hypothetical protein